MHCENKTKETMTKEEKIALIKEEFSNIQKVVELNKSSKDMLPTILKKEGIESHTNNVFYNVFFHYVESKKVDGVNYTIYNNMNADNDWNLSTYIGIRIDSSYQQMLNIKDLEKSEYL